MLHLARRGLIIGAVMSLCALAAPAQAQTYPAKPIKVIVDGPAGGINDIWTRRYTQRLSESMGQPVVVENRPGASGSIAAEALARSPADGYTLMYGGMNPLVAFPGAGGVIRYDPVKDFTPVALGTMGYPAFVISSSLGIKTLAEFQQRAKAAKPEEFACGTSGQAGVQHFACAMVERALGIKMRMVPYKGGSAALMDAAAGNIQVSVGYTAELEPFTGPGRLTVLAAFAPIRMPKFPTAPSFAEAGFPNMEMPSFAGFFMPANAPRDAVERFNAEAIKAMARPEMTEWRTSVGGYYELFKPAEFGNFVRGEQSKWRKMSDEFNIKAEQAK
jgi:tripartite-type tricarboxylate transporter receptor subunit TctC